LSDCHAGDIVKVSAVIHTSSEFLKFLNNREIRLGTKIKIKSVEPFDRSMIVTYDNRQETFSLTASERLLVEKAK
jgi:DtxR family Mn-dependent transcriptional regulator